MKGGLTLPRCARLKSPDSVYHIMVRSISDTPLFKCPDDKDKYLRLISKYQYIYFFKVYAYCLMDTHAHLIIDCAGADISSIMHAINQSYAQYFNYKYNRHGHLFQDRFKSKIIQNDRYLITLSLYIHNNPSNIKGMKGYSEIVNYYKYSSLGIYLDIMDDDYGIVDPIFVLSQFSEDRASAMEKYLELIRGFDGEEPDENDAEFKNEKAEYRSERRIIIRNIVPADVVNFVSTYTNQDRSCINIKYIKRVKELKSLSALLMRGLCNMKQVEICGHMGSITQSQASKLCLEGFKLVNEKQEYRNIIVDFIKQQKAS